MGFQNLLNKLVYCSERWVKSLSKTSVSLCLSMNISYFLERVSGTTVFLMFLNRQREKVAFATKWDGSQPLAFILIIPVWWVQGIKEGVDFLRPSLKVKFFSDAENVPCLWEKHRSTKGGYSKGKKIRDMYISVYNIGCRLTVCTEELEFWNTWLEVINLLKESFKCRIIGRSNNTLLKQSHFG